LPETSSDVQQEKRDYLNANGKSIKLINLEFLRSNG
jgi:hypothetical protein